MGLLALGLASCGGAVEREPKENPEPAGETPAGDPSEDDGPLPGAQEDLGKCMTGFDRTEEPDRDCNWVVKDRCYEDKLEACACACPSGTAVTTCSSGFPQQNGRVPVYCS